jgi:hypothetical protein
LNGKFQQVNGLWDGYDTCAGKSSLSGNPAEQNEEEFIPRTGELSPGGATDLGPAIHRWGKLEAVARNVMECKLPRKVASEWPTTGQAVDRSGGYERYRDFATVEVWSGFALRFLAITAQQDVTDFTDRTRSFLLA